MRCHGNPTPLFSNPMAKILPAMELKGRTLPAFYSREGIGHILKMLSHFPWKADKAKAGISRTKRTILSVCKRQGTVSGLVGCHILTVHPSSDHSEPLCRNELGDPCAEEENRRCVFGEFSFHCWATCFAHNYKYINVGPYWGQLIDLRVVFGHTSAHGSKPNPMASVPVHYN